jgi:hypothetical protein
MSIADNKFIQIDGAAVANQQPVSESVFNDELRTWGEYKQTDSQALVAATPVKVTCDGVEKSVFAPSGGVDVWDTGTNVFSVVSGAFYMLRIGVAATAGTNNTSLVIALVDPSTPSTIYFEDEVQYSKAGDSETHIYLFTFFASFTGDMAIYAEADKNMTVDDVAVVAKREI